MSEVGLETDVQGEEAISRLRRRILDAAQRLVERDGGLTVSLAHLSLDKVIHEAGVSRSSMYREWQNKDDFHVDLLCDMAGPNWQGTAAFDERTIKIARDVVAEHLDQLQTQAGRRKVLEETVRRAVRQNFEAVIASVQWRTYVALTATVLSLSVHVGSQRRVQQALQTAERGALQRMGIFYEDMAIILGLRLRPFVDSYETLAAAGAAVVEGLALRRTLTPELVDEPLDVPKSDGSALVTWHLAARSFLGILDELVEAVSDAEYSFPDALTTYMKRLGEREASATTAMDT